MKTLKNIAWIVFALWGIGLIISIFSSDSESSNKAETESSVGAASPIGENTDSVSSHSPVNQSDLTCYPYIPVVSGDRNSVNLNGSACVGYFHAYTLASNSGNTAALNQLNNPEIQKYIETVAKIADTIEESCPRDGLSEMQKGYSNGKAMFEINISLVSIGSVLDSTIVERGKQCQLVYEYYGGILNNRLSNL